VPKQPPSERFTGAAEICDLPAGTVLSRVHRTHYGAEDFNPVASDVVFGGGRFDATELDRYDYLYAGEGDATAVAEALLRDIDSNDRGYRFLHKKYWGGRQLSRLRTTTAVPLVALRTGIELGAVGADTWLATCDPDEYPQTRAWGHWLRSIVPTAAGFAWLSKREPGTTSYVLFGDRCPTEVLLPNPGPLPVSCAFDDPEGQTWLRDHLAKYRVSIRRS
jgi:hypothetical protein